MSGHSAPGVSQPVHLTLTHNAQCSHCLNREEGGHMLTCKCLEFRLHCQSSCGRVGGGVVRSSLFPVTKCWQARGETLSGRRKTRGDTDMTRVKRQDLVLCHSGYNYTVSKSSQKSLKNIVEFIPGPRGISDGAESRVKTVNKQKG